MQNRKNQFDDYYNEYQDMVKTLCLGYSNGDRETANDLVQETFINLWRALHKFEGRSSAKTWIYRICVNTCLLHLRKNKNKRNNTLDIKHLEIPEEAQSDKQYKPLYQAIGQLKELDRLIIMLVLEELSYSEIAEIMGITEGNLRVKISRAKQHLNKLLSHGR